MHWSELTNTLTVESLVHQVRLVCRMVDHGLPFLLRPDLHRSLHHDDALSSNILRTPEDCTSSWYYVCDHIWLYFIILIFAVTLRTPHLSRCWNARVISGWLRLWIMNERGTCCQVAQRLPQENSCRSQNASSCGNLCIHVGDPLLVILCKFGLMDVWAGAYQIYQ